MRSHLLIKLILATAVAAKVPAAPEPVERPKGLNFGTRGEPPHPPPPCPHGEECPHPPPPPPPCHEGHCEEHYVHPIPPPPPPEDCDEWGNPIIKVEIIECPPDKLDCPWRDHGEKHPYPPPPPPPYDCPEECKPEHCVYHPEGFYPPPCPPGGKCLPPCPPHCPPPPPPPPPPPCHEGHCEEHYVHPYPPPPPYDCPEECKPEHCVYHPEGFHPLPCPPGGKCLPPCPPHCPPPPPPYHHGEYHHPECRPEICIIVIEGEEPHYEPGKEHLPHCPVFCKDQPPHGEKHPYPPPPQEECPPECKPEICIIVIEGEEPHYESGKEHLPHCPKHCEKYHGVLPLTVSPPGASSTGDVSPGGPGGYGPTPTPSSSDQSQEQGGLTPVPAPGGNTSPGGRPNVVPVSGATERGYGGFYFGMLAVLVAAVWF